VRIIQLETLVRWHRAGFRCYWRWKSLGRGARPQIQPGLRALIRQMSMENPLWGAPRIHGELLKLGFAAAQSSVAKYMVSQGWKTFLRNHAPDIAVMDLFLVPTIGFKLSRELDFASVSTSETSLSTATTSSVMVLSLRRVSKMSASRAVLRLWQCL